MEREDIIDAVEEAMDKKFQAYGFRIAEPNDMQADMIYLRKMRLGSEAIGKHAIRAIVSVVVPTGIYMAWGWFRDRFVGPTI